MKMASKLPDADSKRNGLLDLTKRLVEDPEGMVACVVLVDASQILLDVDKRVRTPTIRVQHIEPLLDRTARSAAMDLLGTAYRARTSEQLELPLFDDDRGMMFR